MNYQTRFEKFLKKYKVIGASSIICDKEGIINSAYYGYQDRENNIKTTANTIYRVASISKVIVALGVMHLVEEGIIDINEDISNYLGYSIRNPYFPNDVITIKMLMTQTSSLNDAGDGEKGYYGSQSGYIDIPLNDLINDNGSRYFTPAVWNNTKPGTTWNYCNFGCGILACIIEKCVGYRFCEYIKDILLKPLDIKSGFRLNDIEDVNNLAVHYLYNEQNDNFEIYRNYDSFLKYQSKIFSLGNNYTGVAGGLYIKATDLSKIMILLMNNGKYQGMRLFEESTIKEMKKIHWQGDSYDNAYRKKGLQLVNLEIDEVSLLGHFGNACGLRSFMLFDDKKGIICIINGADYLGNEDHLTKLLADIIKYMYNYC